MAKKTKRVSVPKSIETKLLIKSGRRCPLCVYLKNDFDTKNLQIAHIDNDPSNNDLDNLILICLDHHTEIHQKNPISKGFSHKEIKYYRDLLYKEKNVIIEKSSSNTQTLHNQSLINKEKKDQIKQEIIRAFEEGDYKSFYASIYDFGFKEITRIMQWIVIESYDAYTDGINKVELRIDKRVGKDIEVGGIIYVRSGSETYNIHFSPITCQILFDVRQFSCFNKEGKPILADGWDSQYSGSLMQMYFDNQTQKYGWHSFERHDIEDRSEEARNNILMYLKEKLNVI
jgi:hypothetical protein